jgi:HEAT repeat protein
LAGVLCSSALSYPRPPRGVENIPKLMADAALVCKGEVVESAGVTVVSNPGPPHRTATAIVHVDRCFKGEQPTSELVPVLFDNILPLGGGPYVVLRPGDYSLFFLKPEKDNYVLVDDWSGQLSISRQLAATPFEDTDPMHRLEMDLKAGLNDHDRERVLDSIRMLGSMRHLRSDKELASLLDSQDPLVRTYVFEALLRLHDYSVLPAVEQWLMAQPPPPAALALPGDALFEMQGRLVGEISLIRDPSTLPILLRLLQLPNPVARQGILQAVRSINSPQAAPALLKMLDDSYADNAFLAMHALIGLAGGGVIDWVPTLPAFREDPAYYAARCRQWWQSQHQSHHCRGANNRSDPRSTLDQPVIRNRPPHLPDAVHHTSLLD